MFCLPLSHLSPPHFFYQLYQVSVTVVTFLLNFRHGLSIDRSHVHLSIDKQSFYQEFQQISKGGSFENSPRKGGTLNCHMGVTWFDAVRWLTASCRLIIFLLNTAICPNSCNYSFIFRPNENINCIEYFYTIWKYFLECCGNPFSTRRHLAPRNILREKYCPQHLSGSCHRLPNSPPNELHFTCCCRAIFQLNGTLSK